MVETPVCKVRLVADYFSVSNRTVLDWVRKGKLKAIRTASGQYRITDDSFRKLAQPVPKKPGTK